MVAGMLTKSSDIMLRRDLYNFSGSPASAKSLYLASARVCFRRNNNMNHTLVLSAPRHKLDITCFCSPNLGNKINHNSQHSVINKIVEIKKNVFKVLASLLLFGFLAFMTTRSRRSVSALAATSVLTCCTNCNCTTLIQSHTSSSSTSTSLTCTNCNCTTFTQSYRTTRGVQREEAPSSVSNSCTNSTSDCRLLASLVAETFVYSTALVLILGFLAIPLYLVMLVVCFKITLILVKISFIAIALCIMVPPLVALVNGFLYFLQLCKDDKKTLLVLQVGVWDKARELQTELPQIADTSNLDAMKLEGVMKSLLQRCNSCHFANLKVTQCISDEETQYGEDNDEMPSIWDKDPIVYYKMLKCIIKKLVVIIHSALKTIKKINYNGKYSKQLFREVLTRELVGYDRGKETFANVDGMKYEKTVGGEHGMVDNNYVVVTMMVLASGIYSAPPLLCHTKHINTVLQKFNTIPKSKVESVEVLWTPRTEDEIVSKRKLQRDFSQPKPVEFRAR